MFDGFETSTFILVGNAAALSLLPDSTSEKIRIAVGSGLASTLLGWAIGGTVGSVMADFVGRKKMLMISIAGYCAFTALTAFSGSMTMLIVLRFLTGMFLGAEWSTGTVLVAETWPASARAKALGIMQSGYGFGFLLATGLWLLVRPCGGAEGWRWMFTVGVVPGLLLIYIRTKAPESQLWLEAVSRDQEKQKLSFVALFENRRVVTSAFAVLVIAAVTVSVFYGISAFIGPYIGAMAVQQGLMAESWASIGILVYNAGAIVGYIAAGFLADAIGRKPYMRAMFIGAILSGLFAHLAAQTLSMALASVFILGVFTLGIFSWMPIYLPELFQTRIRSTASGLVFNLARLISFPLPILTASLFSALGGYRPTILLLTLLYVIAIAALATLPETKGRPLPN
jgi:MFS family permease